MTLLDRLLRRTPAQASPPTALAAPAATPTVFWLAHEDADYAIAGLAAEAGHVVRRESDLCLTCDACGRVRPTHEARMAARLLIDAGVLRESAMPWFLEWTAHGVEGPLRDVVAPLTHRSLR